jgi:hypothetical protein
MKRGMTTERFLAGSATMASVKMNPVNYRAGTVATCKQQEKNRLPVKGEIYSEPSSSIWTG